MATNSLLSHFLKSINFTNGFSSPVTSFLATVVFVTPINFSKTCLLASKSDRFVFSVAIVSLYKSSNCLSVNHSLPSTRFIFFTDFLNSCFKVTSLKLVRKLLAGSCGIPKLPWSITFQLRSFSFSKNGFSTFLYSAIIILYSVFPLMKTQIVHI